MFVIPGLRGQFQTLQKLQVFEPLFPLYLRTGAQLVKLSAEHNQGKGWFYVPSLTLE